MNKHLFCLMVAVLAVLYAHGHVAFTGVGQYPVIEVTPEARTGLNAIYVVFDTQGVGMTYTAASDNPVTWYSYGPQGGGYAQEIQGVTRAGNVTTLAQVLPNTGYIIEEGTDRTYLWVCNYADWVLELNDMSFGEGSPCSTAHIDVDGTGEKIIYYGINGSTEVLDREIKLSYNTLEWDDSTKWQEKPVVDKFAFLSDAIEIDPPLCNTVFTLTGDRFLEQWGLGEGIESQTYVTQAVSCGATAVQEDRGNNNEKGLDSGLGGSAPVHIVFTGYPTDAVVYREWQMARDQEFEDIVLQYNQDEVDYVSTEAGTYYWRYVVANAAGNCEYYSDTYTVTVTESELICPNCFSPGSTEGVNDIWKVSYKSLIEFHCWIYNRWGNLVCEFTDPGQGWDGTYHGKLVDTGVFYYVVTAKGSDGIDYKKRGAITILRYKRGSASGGGTATGGVE